MKAKLLLIYILWGLLTGGNAWAQENIFSPDVTVMQQAADEAAMKLDVRALISRIAQGDWRVDVEQLVEFVRQAAASEWGWMRSRLLALIAPALLWAVNRHLLGGGELNEASGWVCFVCGACVLTDMVCAQIALTVQTIRRSGELTAQIFPVLSGLMSVSGASGTANALASVVTLLGGALNVFLERAMRLLCGGAMIAAVAGNLSARLPLNGLFKLFCSAGGWLLGGIMAAFVSLMSLCGVVGSAQNGIVMKAAKYAVGTLLPVVGGDVAGTLDVMTLSASAVRGAAGVTGVVVMLGLCLRPVLRLASGMLCCMIASALTEPVADGALRRCMEQTAQVMRLLLAASSVNAVLFVVLAGVICA